jgi:hypothetical protein
MEPSASHRIPPPAWAGRPPLVRVLGERCVEAATLCAAGLVASAAGVVLSENRLGALIATAVVAVVVGGMAAEDQMPKLRAAAAEAPVADERSSRMADRGEYLVAPWRRFGAVVVLVGLDHKIGEVDYIGRPVVVGAAGLLVGFGVAAGMAARWVRRWEHDERLALYLRDVHIRREAPAAGSSAASGRAPTPEEAARVRRRMMSGQGLDEEDRDVLDRIAAAKAEAKAREGSPGHATERRYVVVPHPGRAVTDRSTEPPPKRIAGAPAPAEDRLS